MGLDVRTYRYWFRDSLLEMLPRFYRQKRKPELVPIASFQYLRNEYVKYRFLLSGVNVPYINDNYNPMEGIMRSSSLFRAQLHRAYSNGSLERTFCTPRKALVNSFLEINFLYIWYNRCFLVTYLKNLICSKASKRKGILIIPYVRYKHGL